MTDSLQGHFELKCSRHGVVPAPLPGRGPERAPTRISTSFNTPGALHSPFPINSVTKCGTANSNYHEVVHGHPALPSRVPSAIACQITLKPPTLRHAPPVPCGSTPSERSAHSVQRRWFRRVTLRRLQLLQQYCTAARSKVTLDTSSRQNFQTSPLCSFVNR